MKPCDCPILIHFQLLKITKKVPCDVFPLPIYELKPLIVSLRYGYLSVLESFSLRIFYHLIPSSSRDLAVPD